MITLVMALVGLYGVLAFSMSRRVGEMGVHIVLGAQGGDVVRLVVRQGVIQIAVGPVVGLGVAAGVSNALSNFQFTVVHRDPVVFGGLLSW